MKQYMKKRRIDAAPKGGFGRDCQGKIRVFSGIYSGCDFGKPA